MMISAAISVKVPPEPQLTGALGAALVAKELFEENNDKKMEK